MLNKTYKLTQAGLLAALSLAIFVMSRFLHLGLFSVGVIQTVLIMCAVLIIGLNRAVYVFAVAAIAGLILTPSSYVLSYIAFFGSYPLIKAKLNLLACPFLTGPAVKAVYFAVVWFTIVFANRVMRFFVVDGIFYSIYVGMFFFILAAFIIDFIIDRYAENLRIWLQWHRLI